MFTCQLVTTNILLLHVYIVNKENTVYLNYLVYLVSRDYFVKMGG